MDKFLNKIKFVLLSMVLAVTLAACSSGQKKKEIVDTDKDKFTKVMILTAGEDVQPSEYASAKSLQQNNVYQKKHNKDEKIEIIHDVVGNDADSKTLDKVFEDIKNDKELNVLVVSSDNAYISQYVKGLKNIRRDIITISTISRPDIDELASSFDIVLDYDKKVDAREIVDMAKTLGAERFVTIVDEDFKFDEPNKNLLSELKESASKINTPYEEIKLKSGMDKLSKKAYVSNKVNEYIIKYGNDINFYSTTRDIDEVLLNKLVSDKFIISELSQRNSTKFMMDVFGLKQISRMGESYKGLNEQISNFFSTNYGFAGKVAGIAADPKSHIIRYATQLGITLNSKSTKIERVYNTYFLEKVSTIRTQISAGFKTPYSQYKNYKIMSVDQIIY